MFGTYHPDYLVYDLIEACLHQPSGRLADFHHCMPIARSIHWSVTPSVFFRTYIFQVRFRPYDLSYVSLGVTSKHDLSDPRRFAPSEAGDRRAKMYYSTAREYAKAQGLSIRGPKYLLNATTANMGINWCNRVGKGAAYAFAVYDAGWPTGFRDFELENIEQLKDTMTVVGVPHDHVTEFDAYRIGDGPNELKAGMREADTLGCAGVPHICFDMIVDEETAMRADSTRIRVHTHPTTMDRHFLRRTGWFGREHLSFVRHQLHALGLAKRDDVVPDVSHYWPATA